MARLFGCTQRAVEIQVQRGRLKARKVKGSGGPGGKRSEIALSSLPLDTQLKRVRSKSDADMPSVSPSTTTSPSRGAVNLAELPDSYIEKGQRRLRIVEKARSLNGKRNTTEAMRELARREQISLGTLYRWLKTYKESGLDPLSLVPEKPKKRRYSFDQEACDHLVSLYCRPQQAGTWECYCLTKKKAKEKGWKVGSYGTACRILEEYGNAIKIRGREGKKAFRDRFEPKILRDFSDLGLNEVWVGDHTVLNIIVKTDPVLWSPTRTRAREYARPWITMFEDLRSRMVSGLHLSFMPSSQTIALALRHAILPKEMGSCDIRALMEKIGVDVVVQFQQFAEWEWPVLGIPYELYIDNGKDFRAKRFEGGLDRFGKVDYSPRDAAMLEEMGITPRHTTPYLARSKPIESFFRPLKEFIGTLPGAWQGKNPRKSDKAKVEKDKREGRILTMEELRILIEMWLVFCYHMLPHRGKGMDGKCPLEVWIEERENTTLRTASRRVLDFLLMKVEKRTVSDKGVRIFNEFYESIDLMPLVGRRVEVRYDPADISSIHVFCGREYVCTAESMRYLSMHPSEDDLKERLRQQRQYRKKVEQEVEELQARAQYPDPLERIMAIKEERGRKVKRELRQRDGGEIPAQTRFDKVPEAEEQPEPYEESDESKLILWDFERKEREAEEKAKKQLAAREELLEGFPPQEDEEEEDTREPEKEILAWDWQKKEREEESDERSTR